jgi:hypothetical protein
MTEENIIRVEFLVDLGRKETPAHISTEYVHSGATLYIPEVPADMADHLGDHVTMIRLKAFKEVNST